MNTQDPEKFKLQPLWDQPDQHNKETLCWETHDTRCYLQDNRPPRIKKDAEHKFGTKSTKSVNRNQVGIVINKHSSQVATEAVNYIITNRKVNEW